MSAKIDNLQNETWILKCENQQLKTKIAELENKIAGLQMQTYKKHNEREAGRKQYQDKDTIRRIFRLYAQGKSYTWLEQGYNIIFLGPPGVGKTHISIGIGIEAISNGYKVRFISMADLIHILKTQEISSVSRNTVKHIVESDLFIIDDLMFMAMEKNEANLFFQLVNKLYGQTSVVITSNKSPEVWGELLGDQAITTAILDRIVHKCEVINFFNDDSYRVKHRQTIFQD